MVLLLPIPISLLVSSLRLEIKLTLAIHSIFTIPELQDTTVVKSRSKFGSFESIQQHQQHFIMRLSSPNRNLTFVEQNGYLLVDSIPIASVEYNFVKTLQIGCLNDALLRISMDNNSRTMFSPSLCEQISQLILQIGDDNTDKQSFNVCISNVTIANKILLNRWCSNEEQQQQDAQSDGPQPPSHNIEQLHKAEPLRLLEGATVPIQWKNIYPFLQHSRYSISNDDVIFRLVEPPLHGQLLKGGQPVNKFTYNDILANKIHFRHDGSETVVDNIDLQVEIPSKLATLPNLRNNIYSILVLIKSVNDPPEIRPGTDPKALHISGESKVTLDNRVVSLWDADSDPETVYVSVIASYGVRLENVEGNEIQKFTQRDFLNNKVRIVRSGRNDRGTLKLIASDGELQSNVFELTFHIVPIEIKFKTNTGLKVLHQTANIITPGNLTFSTNFPGIPIEYTIVDLPEYGAVECLNDFGQFQICSTFTQNDIDNLRVRYKHTGAVNPMLDSFSFQVRAENTISVVHLFQIAFIPVHVKIFSRAPFLLNSTDNLTFKRKNLFAWTFPKTFPTNQLIYHIIEPPKFGTLSRRLENNRNRRIGVSSNFTQKHIDDEEISYKMHFVQYSIVNDFFTFRVITPSITSEVIRFEITYIPGHGSIQLINRTVIVNEGGIQKITNESLSLKTPDDSDFVFTINVAPIYGNILVSNSVGLKYVLTNGENFTTSHINSERVFYKHMDGENRMDRVFLIAESVRGRTNRIPFWLSFKMILKNDNIPKLFGDNTIQITDHGERLLHPGLLPWTDDDIDGQPLRFIFHGDFRHAAFLSTSLPNILMRNFTQRQMQNGEVLIRHFGHSRKFRMNYTVSDGIHDVQSTLTIIVSEPFIRVQHSSITITSSNTTANLMIPITNQNLSAITNIDSMNSDIYFTVTTKAWILVTNSTEKMVQKFTQQDIDDGLLFYRITEPITDNNNKQLITVTVANLTTTELFNIFKNQSHHTANHLEMRILTQLTVPLSSISQIDKNILLATAVDKKSSEIIFDIIRQPKHGSLILEAFKATNNGRTITPSTFFVSRFTQAHVNAGQIQYVHDGVLPIRDSIIFNVSVGKQMIGPYTLFIDVFDDKIELSVSNITVVSGSSKLLNSDVLHVETAGENEIEFRIFSYPQHGWIVRERWNLSNITSIKQFNVQEIANHQIHYVSNPRNREMMDTFEIAACVKETRRCTEARQVTVFVTFDNSHEPELLRNEVMKMWNTHKATITKQHLYSRDDDTSPEQIHYLISGPLNGYVALAKSPDKAITNFTQAEISKAEIIFVKNADSAASGGFSFLVSDGVHHIGPEWFKIESSQGMKIAPDVNGRLIVPPGKFPTVIGSDLLKIQLPNVKPHEILYSIMRTPKLGHLFLSGLHAQKFTQDDINHNRLTYKPDSDFLDEWIKKDLFLFKISTNNASDYLTTDEHRFKISITYAALPSHRLYEFIQLTSAVVSPGGSVAINKSHINMDIMQKYCHDELLLEFSRKPHYGHLDVLGVVPTKETYLIRNIYFSTGRSLIYRHQKTNRLLSDEILLHIMPINSTNYRTNRLRIILPVILLLEKDLSMKIKAFPERIKLMAGGEYLLVSEVFQVIHPNIEAKNLEYRLLQAGSNGVKLLKNNIIATSFTQDDINIGKIRLYHQYEIDSNDQIDVIVFQIGDHIRALIVYILPLSLSLSNHSDITYVQGKTYVVLNRTHLSANLNTNRSKIIYQITKPPENGTFYWVAGESETITFTQNDIDEERVLYAQLNMQAFQDRFEFTVRNDLGYQIQNYSYVRVLPVFYPQTLIADANHMTPITTLHLNASNLKDLAPRFLVIKAPRFGRLISTYTNNSIAFFTYNDLLKNRIFYIPFETKVIVRDFVELQLDANNIQPARFRFNITIQPSSRINQQLDSSTNVATIDYHHDYQPTTPSVQPQLPTIIPSTEAVRYDVLIILLLLILAITILILLYRRHSTQQKRMNGGVNVQNKRELDKKIEANFEKQPDLLDTTVYATIGRNRLDSAGKRPQQPLQTFDVSQRHASWASSPAPHRLQPQPRTLSGASLDNRSLSARNTPEQSRSRPDRYHSTKLKENQYWV